MRNRDFEIICNWLLRQSTADILLSIHYRCNRYHCCYDDVTGGQLELAAEELQQVAPTGHMV